MTSPLTRMLLAVGAIVLGVGLLAYRPVPDSLDGEALLAASAAWVRTGAPTIDAIAYTDWVMPPNAGMGAPGIDGALYSKKGITPSIALLPFVIAAQWTPLTARAAAMLLNPIVTAITAILVAAIVVRLGFRLMIAAACALLYGVATPAWPYAGTLFGEPLAALLIVGSVWLVVPHPPTPSPFAKNGQIERRSKKAPSATNILLPLSTALSRQWRGGRGVRDLLAGVLLATLIGVNTAYAPAAAMIVLFAVVSGGRPSFSPLRYSLLDEGDGSGVRDKIRVGVARALLIALPLAIGGAALLAFNAARFGDPFSSGYRFAAGEGFIHPLIDGVFGLTLSPYRGLLWYAPIVVLAIPGATRLWSRARGIVMMVMGITAAVILAFATWWSWYGGVVWGTRFLVPILPVIAVLFAPMLDAASRRRSIRVLVVALAAVSIGVQILGVTLDHLTYYAYLIRAHGSADPAAIIASLDRAVFTDPALSPIVGHLALLLNGWPLHPLAARAPVVLVAAAAVIAFGVGIGIKHNGTTARRHKEEVERGKSKVKLVPFYFLFVPLCLCAVVIAFAPSPDPRIDRLQGAIAASGIAPRRLIANTTHYGTALLDLETIARVTSFAAPVEPDDARARRLWDHAATDSPLAVVTWLDRCDAANAWERDLWARAAFAGEWPLVEDGHRLAMFDTRTIAPDTPIEVRFGAIALDAIGVRVEADGVRAAFRWRALEPPMREASWFTHVIDADGVIRAQQDRAPGAGCDRVADWPIDHTTIDRAWFAFAPPGDVSGWAIRIGWVDAAGAVVGEYVTVPLD